MTKSFLPIRFMRIPNKPEFIEPTHLLRGTDAPAITLFAYPSTKTIAVWILVSRRNPAIANPCFVLREVTKSFLPICFTRIPNQPEFIQPTFTLGGTDVALTLSHYPSTKIIAVWILVSLRNQTIANPCFVLREVTKSFLPICFTRTQNKPESIQPTYLLRGTDALATLLTLVAYPLTKIIAVWILESPRNQTIANPCFVLREMTKSFLPIRFTRIPDKPEFIEPTFMLRGTDVLALPLCGYPSTKAIAVWIPV